MTTEADPKELTGAETLAMWWEKPYAMVEDLWHIKPDPYQHDVLADFPHTPRQAMKAAKGVGKTTTEAWIAWNYLLTRPHHPNIAATSISGDNLKSNLWKEMAVWYQKSPLLQRAFEITSMQIFNRKHPRTWWMQARTWPKSADKEAIGTTLAGLHQPHLLFLIDESGGIPPEILLSAEAGFSSLNTKECHIVQGGNTNSLQGALYFACVKNAKLWKTYVVNSDPDSPLCSPRANLEWAREQIATYGRDNPYVKVSILGEWPASSFNALIGPAEVEEAMHRHHPEYQFIGAPKVLGVDVARQGLDASVIFPRQGIVAFNPQVLRNVTSLVGAGAVARKWMEWDADSVFIDATGGFGAGWIDQLSALGRSAIGVQFSGEAHQKSRYFNKRAEMYFDAVQWIKMGGQLPECPELLGALTETTYTFQGDRLILEPKDDIAARLGYSPDHADAFVLGFAEPVSPRNQPRMGKSASRVMPDYDPFAGVFDAMDK